MSVLGKDWHVRNTNVDSSLLEKLFANRGLTSEDEIDHFLNPTEERDFHDPFLMEHMERAVERISQAIEKSERIMIFGDYDVDGITGSAILMRALRTLGANVSYRLPHRVEDGYGLREKFIHEFKALNVALAITVDNGISAYNEIEKANELGIDVIITDHHTVPESIPKAYAILHPKMPDTTYPFSELTGSAVALKLAQALFMRKTENHREHVTPLLDLACMGTITDFGELRGENRYIVKEGLRVLANTRWPGLSRLKEVAGMHGESSTYDIGFLLGPRINAAGRIDHPSHALKLLLHDSANTGPLAAVLDNLNKKRQKLTEDLMIIATELAISQINNSVIIIHHPEFHSGVIGLLAAKIVEKFGKPTIVMETREKNLVGSCRSISGINIVAALTKAKKYLSHFGGHAMAAGFDVDIEHLDAFKKDMEKFVSEQIPANGEVKGTLNLECEIFEKDINLETAEMIAQLAPFGTGNDVPRFLLRDVTIKAVNTVGKTKKHLKMTSTLNGKNIDIVGFGFGDHLNDIRKMEKLDIVCELEKNVWNGRTSTQLKLVDFTDGKEKGIIT